MPLLSKRVIFITIGLLCLISSVGPSLALLTGILTTIITGRVYQKESVRQATNWLLKASVVGLGFGMDFFASIEAGKRGFVFTILSIVTILGLGYYLAQKFSVDTKTSILISSGTAICGGSAIAAITPAIDASNKQASVALGIIFILNSIALLLFPFLGKLIELNQVEFGYWAAIAIHDTSSVIGAAAGYGSSALSVATSVKLGRALWILPLTFIISFVFKAKDRKITFPYFILFFLGAMLLNTFVPSSSTLSNWLVPLARKSLTLTLFLIGTGLSIAEIKGVGVRPLINALILWIFISIGSLWMITTF